MIALIEGTVVARSATGCVILTGCGVGYQLLTSLQTLAGLPEAGGRVRLHVHTHVREDAIQLFGFLSEGERAAFLELLRVSKIGPRLALNLLSGLAVDELVRAVQAGDVRRLARVPGIGKKTAERIVVELRESLKLSGGTAALTAAPAAPGDAFGDVESALLNMGFKPSAVDSVVQKLRHDQPAAPLDELLRTALSLIR